MPSIFGDKYLGEHHKAARWLMIAFVIQGLLTFAAMILSFPMSYVMERGYDFSRLNDPEVREYFRLILDTGGFYVLIMYYKWIIAYAAGETQAILPAIPVFSIFVIESLLRGLVPYNVVMTIDAFSNKANLEQVKAMKIWDGFIIVLGRFKKKFLKFSETLSALAFAPPGTGKTAAIVIPTIFECDTVSMIVNDPKPELCYITSGYRAQIGPVFIMNWAKQDDPETGVYYPSWNPLSPGTIPPDGPARNLYIDTMVNVFVEDPKGSAADPHWSKTGRNALSGFINYIVSKIEHARASDYFAGRLNSGTFTVADAAQLEAFYLEMSDAYAAGALTLLREGNLTASNYVPVGTWVDIPGRWIGKEACIPMLLDWMAEAQVNIAEDVRRRKEGGDQMAALADPMKEMLENAVIEARRYGYSHRAILELTQLAATPDKERGSILSTALSGISIFKNQAVRQRTSRSDFTFKDLRGMKNPKTGEFEPLTVYLSVNQADAKALNTLSGVFIELMSYYLVSTPPGTELEDKTKAGPCSVLFVLDEFPQMPKLEAVIQGPAVGRGQKVSYLLIAQDLAQITEGYGPNAIETLMSTTAAKILLTQNNENTAKRFATIMGKQGIVKQNYKNNGVLAPFDNHTEYVKGDKDVISSSSIMMLSESKQIVIMQRWSRHPIECESPRYYKDPQMLAKSKIPSAPPMPEWIRLKNNA
ncbi:MAG: type IV secretory system conjugative DNA transfer family protein [Rickettsiales bacterium]|nr:type IV secretory system conjugative DNA transfer family protein [Rickettsiales bacterium]